MYVEQVRFQWTLQIFCRERASSLLKSKASDAFTTLAMRGTLAEATQIKEQISVFM
jgi:hypothetical protein